MCKKWENAYMTIEASLIFPMILGGIIFTIYLGIYLYNVSVIKQAAYIAALRGSQLINTSSSEIEGYVKEQLECLLDSKILIKENIRQEIKVSYGKIKVKLSMDMNVSLNKGVFSKMELWKVEKEAVAMRYHPVNFIRKVRKRNESQVSK